MIMAENHSESNPLYYTNISKGYPGVVREKQNFSDNFNKRLRWEFDLNETTKNSYRLKPLEADQKKNYQCRLTQISIPSKDPRPSSEIPHSNDPRKIRQCMKECMKELLRKTYKYPAIDEIQNESSDDDHHFLSSFRLQNLSGSLAIDPSTGRLYQASTPTLKNVQVDDTLTSLKKRKHKNINCAPSTMNVTNLAKTDRRRRNTENDISTRIHNDNDQSSENDFENINDNAKNVDCYPELIADAVGPPVRENFALKKTSIKLKCSYSQYRSFTARNDKLSSRESSDDEANDDYTSFNDSIRSVVGNKNILTDFHSNWKSEEQPIKNTTTENEFVPENTYVLTSNSEDLSDMETRIGPSKPRRISRIPSSTNDSEKNGAPSADVPDTFKSLIEEKKLRMQGKLKENELKRFPKAEKRKNDRVHYSAKSRKIQTEISQDQKRENSLRICDRDYSPDSSSSKQFSSRRYNNYSRGSLRCSEKRDVRRAHHLSSPYPDKKQKTERNSTQKQYAGEERKFDRRSLPYENSSRWRDRSNTERGSKRHTESKKKETTRSSIDSGFGRITPPHEVVDNREFKKETSNSYYKHHTNSKHSKRSGHSGTSKSSYETESIESLKQKSLKIQEELKKEEEKLLNNKENANKLLSLPFIDDGDDSKLKDDLTYNNYTKDCIHSIHESTKHDKVDLENDKEIINNEVQSNDNQKIPDDSASIHKKVNKLLSNVVDYSSSSDENNDLPKSMVNQSSVNASDIKAESIETNLTENKVNIESFCDENVEYEDKSAEPKDDKSIINKENLDSKNFLDNKEVLKSSQSSPLSQISSNISEIEIVEKFTEYIGKNPKILTSIFKLWQKQENLEKLNIQKILTCDNDEPEVKCKPVTPPLIQKEPTETLDQDIGKNSNVSKATPVPELNNKETSTNKYEVQTPVMILNVVVPVVGVPEVSHSDTTSTSTATITSSAHPLNSSTTCTTVLATTTSSSITTQSQLDSHVAINNRPCSLTTIVSNTLTSSLSTTLPTTSTTQPLPQSQNPSPATVPIPTTSQLHPSKTLTSPSVTPSAQKPPPAYSSLFSAGNNLQKNNSSGENLECKINKQNVSSQTLDKPISTSEGIRQSIHQIIESIVRIRKYFKEFESIIQDPNTSPSSFATHPLSIAVTKIMRSMSILKKSLKYEWEPFFVKIASYSQSFQDNTKRISICDIGTAVYMYCYANNIPIKLSSFYSQKEKTAEPPAYQHVNNTNTAAGTLQPSSLSNTTGSQGNLSTDSGCTYPDYSGQLVTNSLSTPISHNQQNYSLPAEPTPQQLNIHKKPNVITSMSMNQNQQNSVPTNIPTQASRPSSNINYGQTQQRHIVQPQIPRSKVNYEQQLHHQSTSLVNQKSSCQVHSPTIRQSNVTSSPAVLTNMNNQLLYNQPGNFQPQNSNNVLMSVPFLNANNNQQFYNPQLYKQQSHNQQVYNQSSAPVSQQPNIIPKSVPFLNVNDNQQYINHSGGILLVQPNIASTPVLSSQTNNQQYNYAPTLSTYPQAYSIPSSLPSTNVNIDQKSFNQQINNQQLYNQQISNQQIYNQKMSNQQIYNQPTTCMYQQQNNFQTIGLNLNAKNSQQFNDKVNTLIPQQPCTVSALRLSPQINNNLANTLIAQRPNAVPNLVTNSNVNNNHQNNNTVITSISQQRRTVSTPILSPNNNQQSYYLQTNTLIQQQPNFVSPLPSLYQTYNNQSCNNQSAAVTLQQQGMSVTAAVPSTINCGQQNYNPSKVSIHPLQKVPSSQRLNLMENLINKLPPSKGFPATSIQCNELQRDNRNIAVKAQAQQFSNNSPNSLLSLLNRPPRLQPITSPLIAIQPEKSQEEICNKAVETQVQQSSVNPPIALQPKKLQEEICNKAVEAQVHKFPITLPTSLKRSKSQKANHNKVVQTQAQQSFVNPPNSIGSGEIQKGNCRRTVEAQAQRIPITLPTLVQTSESRKENHTRLVEIQAQQSSGNLPTSIEFSESQKENHDNKVVEPNSQQLPITLPTLVQTSESRKENHTRLVEIQAQQAFVNQPPSIEFSGSRKENHDNKIVEPNAQQLPITLPTLVHTSESRKENHTKLVEAQAQQLPITPSTLVQTSESQKENHNKVDEAQAQQSSVNQPTLLESDGLIQDNNNKVTTEYHQHYTTNNAIKVTQAIESLSSLLKSFKNDEKSKFPKKKTTKLSQNISIDTKHQKVCTKNDVQGSSTEILTKNNKIDNDIIKQIEIRPSSNSSQKLQIQNETQDDPILVEKKKENTFLQTRNKSNYIEELTDVDINLGFLNDPEDFQEPIVEIKSDISTNVYTNQEVRIKTEKSWDKAISKSSDTCKQKEFLVDDIITLDDNDDEKNDLDKVSLISSDRETFKMDQSDDEIIIEQEHIVVTDIYPYTKGCIEEEIECAKSGADTGIASNFIITDVASITSDEFKNMNEAEKQNNLQANDVPEEIDIKQEIDDNEYLV